MKDLDRITKLGFKCIITWNQQITITYDSDDYSSITDDIYILTYIHDNWPENNSSFVDCIKKVADIFYSWYFKNEDKVKKYISSKDPKLRDELRETCLGNISNSIYRDNRLDSIDI